MQPGVERAGTFSGGGWWGRGPAEHRLDPAAGRGPPESHGGGWRLGPGSRDPEDDHWSRRHPCCPSWLGVGGVGRPRKGYGTTPWIECFWTSAVWGVVLATGICTGSQPSLPATIRSHLTPLHLMPRHLTPRHLTSRHLVPRHLVPLLLMPRHLTPCFLMPRHLDPPLRTLLPLQAWRQAPGRMTTWR